MHRHRSLILVLVALIAAVVIARQVQAPTSPSQSDGPIAAGPGLVLDVLDGDTARIRMEGYEGSVRIVGIDTPEIEHPGKPAGCFGYEAAAAAKAWLARSGNNAYAILMVAGWGASVLMLANAPLADHLGHALFDGQLYFTDAHNLWSIAAFACAGGLMIRWLSRKLLLERMFPDFFRASGLSAARYHLLFDLLAAAGLALATASVGVMAAFTLVFVPTMIAYQWGRSWRQSLVIAVVVGLVAYAVAFQVALVQDQPFGPILVVTMVCAAAGAWLVRKLAYRPSGKAPARC